MGDFNDFKRNLLEGNLDNVKRDFKLEYLETIIDEKLCQPIHVACINGNVCIAKFLVDQQCDVESECEYGNTKTRPIHLACMKGHLEIAKLLIESHCNIEIECGNMRPIHLACMKGHLEIAKLLIEHQCDIESECGKNRMRPIHVASIWGHLGILKFLTRNNCEIHCKTNDGRTPLDIASQNCQKESVEFLNLTNSAREKLFACVRSNDIALFDKLYNSHTLFIRECHTNLFIVEVTVQNCADRIIKYITDKTIDNEELFFLANSIKNGHLQSSEGFRLVKECFLYRAIRSHNADGFHMLCSANLINGNHRIIQSSILEMAAMNGCSAFVPDILRKIVYNKQIWESAKQSASQKRHSEIVQLISNRESIFHHRVKAQMTILHTAVIDNDVDMIQYIMESNLVDPDSSHETFGTALALSHSLCHEECIIALRQFGINPVSRNKFLQTPLHVAIESGMTDHCAYLIERMESIDQKGFMELTALHTAVIHGCPDVCSKLLEKGANCNEIIKISTQFSIGRIETKLPLATSETPLTLCMKIHGTLFPCFLDLKTLSKTVLDTCDGAGNSLLHLSVRCMDSAICKQLIKAGSKVDPVNGQGNTPLLELLSHFDHRTVSDSLDKIISIIELLIESGCDVNKSSTTGTSVFQFASKLKNEKIMMTLAHRNATLTNITGKDFRFVFSEKWFDYSEILLSVLTKDVLSPWITEDIIRLTMSESRSQLIRLLFENANPGVVKSIIEDILYMAVKQENEDIFDYLISYQIDAPRLLDSGETLLTSLIHNRKTKYSLKLLQSNNSKIYVNLNNKMRQSPLELAIEQEIMDVVDILVFESNNLNEENYDGITPLMQLIKKISDNPNTSLEPRLMKAIKSIILRMGDIYKVTTKNVEVISVCSNPSMRTTIESFYKRERESVEKITEEEKMICAICMSNRINCVFQCGHTFCMVCGEKLFQCPNCKMEPTNPKRIYFN